MNVMTKIIVLMSTFNGEKYLREQIDSVLNQKNVEVKLLVRDDGSTDSTKEILEEYRKTKLLDWFDGKNLKPARSFMELVYKAPDFDYYAFCDQDDVWLPDKLDIALKVLKGSENTKPALYYGRPRMVDVNLAAINNNLKQGIEMKDTISSAVVRSKCTGCTIVMNRALRVALCSKEPEYLVMHDAWAHKTCLALSGDVYFDNDVHILYRQHGNNQIGIPKNLKERARLKIQAFFEHDCKRSRMLVSLLDCYGEKMSNENKKLVSVAAYYKKNIYTWLAFLFSPRYHTGNLKRDLAFKIDILFRKF